MSASMMKASKAQAILIIKHHINETTLHMEKSAFLLTIKTRIWMKYLVILKDREKEKIEIDLKAIKINEKINHLQRILST